MVLVVKNPPANAGDMRDTSSIPGSGRSPGGGRGNPLQYSCLENPMDPGAWQATVHRVTKSQIGLKWLSIHFLLFQNRREKKNLMEAFNYLKKKRLQINWEALFNEITVMQVFKSGWWLGQSSRWSQELEDGNGMTCCVRDSRQRPPAEHDTGYKTVADLQKPYRAC